MSAGRIYDHAGETDVPAIGRLLHHAFNGPVEGGAKWVRDSGIEHQRVVRERVGGAPVASLLRVPMGQFFGGKSVPMVGIAGVTVAPESRGRGVANWMMQRSMQEAAGEGFALSALYASTQALYRGVGFEQAGHRHKTKVTLAKIDARERSGTIRPIEDRDEGAVRDLYSATAARTHGMLDRSGYIWSRTRNWREQKFSGFGVFDASGALEGYMFQSQFRGANFGPGEMEISDLAFLSGAAGKRLLGFLAGFSTTVSYATLHGGPIHPLMSLMDSKDHSTEKQEYWMLRVLDVKRALETRGYPHHVRATVEMHVRDDVIAANAGSWTLSVEHGKAQARKEAAVRPALTLDIRALAPLYTGLYTAGQLRMLGWINGEDGAIAAAESIFGGFGTPAMTDFF